MATYGWVTDHDGNHLPAVQSRNAITVILLPQNHRRPCTPPERDTFEPTDTASLPV